MLSFIPTIFQRRNTMRVVALLLAGNCFLLAPRAAFGGCPTDATVTAPVTVDSELSVSPNSRQLVNGSGTVVDTGTAGQIKINLSSSSSPVPLTISTFSSGGAFFPAANTFTSVTNSTQIKLPATGSLAVGSIIALTIGGSQGATSVVTDGGAADENITFNGSTTNTSITIKNGDVVYLANEGSGHWLVIDFVPQGGSSGSKMSLKQGGTGSDLSAKLTGSLLYVDGSGGTTAMTPGSSNTVPVWDGTGWQPQVYGGGVGSSVSQVAATAPTATLMQNAATATGSGTSMNIEGYSVAVISLTGTWAGTVTFEASADNSNWVPIAGADATGHSNSTASAVTADGQYAFNIAGYKSIRARISAYTSGSLTANGFATPVGTISAFQRVGSMSGDLVTRLEDASGHAVGATTGGALKIDGSAVTQPVSGTVTANAGTGTFAVSAASLPLPTGAATSAKQPALGTAGSASSDVISVQGVSGMTSLKVDGSAVTQPISAASLPLPSGAATSVKQPALGTAGSASADVISVQGVSGMTALKVDGSAVTQPVSISTLPSLATGSNTIGSVKITDGTNTAGIDSSGEVKVVGTFSPGYSSKATYSVATTFTPASNATDVLTLTGSSSKTIKIISVYAAYANSVTTTTTQVLNLIRRSSANSGGTSASITPASLDTNNASATATCTSYTANPTTLGTTVATLSTIRQSALDSPSVPGNGLVFPFQVTQFGQPITLRGASDVLAVNMNGAVAASGTVTITIVFTEE